MVYNIIKMTFEEIIDLHEEDVDEFKDTGELSDDLYDCLYEYYVDEMPYGVAKARSGDPKDWISDRFESELKDNL